MVIAPPIMEWLRGNLIEQTRKKHACDGRQLSAVVQTVYTGLQSSTVSKEVIMVKEETVGTAVVVMTITSSSLNINTSKKLRGSYSSAQLNK